MDGNELVKQIRKGMIDYGYSADYMAVMMRMDRSTWYKRLKNPDRIPFGDVVKIDRILKLGLFKI